MERAEAEKVDSEFAADLKEAGALIDANLARVNKLVQGFKNLSAALLRSRARPFYDGLSV